MASIFESLNQLEQLQMMLNNQYAGVSKAAAKAEAIAAGVNSQMPDISEISLASSAGFISATDGVNGIVEQLDIPLVSAPEIVCQNPLTICEEINIPNIVNQISNELNAISFYPTDAIAQQLCNIDYLSAISEFSPIEISLQNILNIAVEIDGREFPDYGTEQETFTLEELQEVIREHRTNPKEAEKKISNWSQKAIRILEEFFAIGGLISNICLLFSLSQQNVNITFNYYATPIEIENAVVEKSGNIDALKISKMYLSKKSDSQYEVSFTDYNGEDKALEIILESPNDATRTP